jgi:lipocalin
MLKFVCVCALSPVAALGGCPPEGFSSIENLNLDSYISKRWYIQQQMETAYLPKAKNWCVYAEYSRLSNKSFWGYDIRVHNYAEEKDGTVHDSDKDTGGAGLLAKVVDEKRGQLEVAPYFLPTFLAGPYWVIDYSEQEGYTLVSGGPPNKEGADGKCRTGSGTNDAGLWIFTRQQKRDDTLIAKVRGIAESRGFDLSVLNDVDQSNCTSPSKQSGPSAILI